MVNKRSGYVPANGIEIYYEMAGTGDPFLMIHAGIADSRQWDAEFAHFAQHYTVILYDMRGYGKTKPIAGEYRSSDDLHALLDALHITEPLIVMGASMGGTLAMDFTLSNPARVRALIMVASNPSGFKFDAPESPALADALKAWEAGDLDAVNDYEFNYWVVGEGRSADQLDPAVRTLALEMNLIALQYEHSIERRALPDLEPPALHRLSDLQLPVMVISGANDVPFMQAAATHMTEQLPQVQHVVMQNAAHLPNLEHPAEFQQHMTSFLLSNGL